MPAINVPIGQGFYQDDSLPISAQECVNLYPSIPQTRTFTTGTLLTTPGISEIAMAGLNEFNRGGEVLGGNPYVINGEKLFRIDRSFDAFGVVSYEAVEVGDGLIGDERVITSENGNQLCIVIPGLDIQFNAWIYTEDGGLLQVFDLDFDGPVSSVVYNSGFFVFSKKDGNKFFVSSLRDGFSYNALDFGSAEVDPDPIVAPFSLKNQLFIFGTQTIQSFQNVGGADFPYVAIPGQVLETGLASKFAIVEMAESMVFLGRSDKEQPAIWSTNGGTIQKLSTTAIDQEISKYTDDEIASCFAYKYGQAGAYFAIFTFPGQRSFVYEETSQTWQTRESFIGGEIVPYRVSTVLDAYGELIIGDFISSKIGILDRDVFTEFDGIIRRRFVTPPIDNEGQPFFVNALELLTESGVGIINEPAPMVGASYSTNGGRTFSNAEFIESGAVGEYDFRSIWTQWGRVSRNISIKIEVSDPVKWVFVRMELWLN